MMGMMAKFNKDLESTQDMKSGLIEAHIPNEQETNNAKAITILDS